MLTGKIVLTIILVISFLLSLIGLGGAAVAFISVFIFSWITGFAIISPKILWILFFMALFAEFIEILAGTIGAKTFNASKQAVWGSVIGIIIGLFLGIVTFQLYLIFLGLILGIVFGELIAGRTEAKVIFKSLLGVLIGKVGGIVVKATITLVMVVVSIIYLF